MTKLTIKAPDHTTALEMVRARLGEDALILSVESTPDGVQVTALQDPLPQAAPPPRRRVNVVIDDTPPELAPVHEPAPRPAPRAEKPAAPGALPAFLTAKPEAALISAFGARPQPPADPATDTATLTRAHEAREAVARAGRVVLVGPAGGGKSMLALQLAAMRLSGAQTGADLVFCGSGSRCDAGMLVQKANLLGLPVRFESPYDLGPPKPGQTQIVILSGRTDADPEVLRHLLRHPGAACVLVAPAGLRTDRFRAIAGQWDGQTTSAVLSADPSLTPSALDRSELAAANLLHLWTARSDRIVGGLTLPGQDVAERTQPAQSPEIVAFRHRASAQESTA